MRLSDETLALIPKEIAKPKYNRNELDIGIVHLGIGAFHRCHMAIYTDSVLAQNGGNWKILGVSLRSNKIAQQLNPQNGLYTIAVKDTHKTHEQVIASIAKVLFAPEDAEAVVAAIANKNTHIVSLTITEKGYCHDPATGELNETHPDIVHDLLALKESGSAPKSAIGFIVAGLGRRQASGKPLTILSCDNLRSNGSTLRKIVSRFAHMIDPELAGWINDNVSFPCTMVDRIVPAMEELDIKHFAQRTGVIDQAVLQTEPFTQWIIEDNFAGPRPAWENVGASLVDDVEAYEEAKLRMLNGSHSALAYLGHLAGFKYVHQAMAQPDLRQFVDTLMHREAATSLTIPQDMDIDQYRTDLQGRYDNRLLPHKTYQIAMDGSQKIPQRLLNTIRHHLDNCGPISACTLAVAAWIRFTVGLSEEGKPYCVQDPLAKQFKLIADTTNGNANEMVKAFLNIEDVFSTDLKQEARFTKELTHWTTEVFAQGVLNTVKKHNALCVV